MSPLENNIRPIQIALAGLIVFLTLCPGLTTYYFLEGRYRIAAAQEAEVRAEAEKAAKQKSEEIKDGIHVESGLIADKGYIEVKNNCTGCHSAKLITQNKATREGWLKTIRWMQKTQKLWDLGENEKIILDYLAKNYAPSQSGRRPQLSGIEWYEIK